jgi:hypothetical protein
MAKRKESIDTPEKVSLGIFYILKKKNLSKQ